jgi:hypothetical protein
MARSDSVFQTGSDRALVSSRHIPAGIGMATEFFRFVLVLLFYSALTEEQRLPGKLPL